MRKSVVLIFLVLLSGCGGTTWKTIYPSEDGYYETNTRIPPESIIVFERIDLEQYRELFFSQADYKDAQKYQTFYRDSIANIGYFDRVLLQDEMEQLILDRGLADKVTSVSDSIGLYHAQKYLGKFLIGDLSIEYKGGHDYEAELKVIDPADGKVYFHVTHRAFNFDGLDQPLFLPMFNTLIDWIKMNSEGYQYVKPEPVVITGLAAAEAESNEEQLAIDVSGRYVSEITSDSIYVFKPGYQRIEFTMVQKGDRIQVTSTQPDLDIKAKFKDGGIAFTVGKSIPCGCSYIEGIWRLNTGGNGFSGSWKRYGGIKGSWNLVKYN